MKNLESLVAVHTHRHTHTHTHGNLNNIKGNKYKSILYLCNFSYIN